MANECRRAIFSPFFYLPQRTNPQRFPFFPYNIHPNRLLCGTYTSYSFF